MIWFWGGGTEKVLVEDFIVVSGEVPTSFEEPECSPLAELGPLVSPLCPFLAQLKRGVWCEGACGEASWVVTGFAKVSVGV